MSKNDSVKSGLLPNFFENLGKIKQGHETILIVDSNSDERTKAKNILSKEGYRVYTASDGTQAQNMMLQCSNDINLCLIDPDVSGKSGGQIISEMLHVYPEIKVAVYNSSQIKDLAFASLLECKQVPKLDKPFCSETISKFVKQIFQKKLEI